MSDDPRLDPAAFVRAETIVATPSLVPEIRLHLATEITPLWQATEDVIARANLPPPYWAFAWPGGQALARYVIEHPMIVAGKDVLDFAAGSGLVAIAAAIAGARHVTANDIDAFAAAAIALNAGLNGVALALDTGDLTARSDGGWEVILAGDVCYERPMAERAIGWLRARAATGVTVLIADPGRSYLPKDGLAALARYCVPTSRELEDRTLWETTVYRLSA